MAASVKIHDDARLPGRSGRRGAGPILVTGMPRSGTTWVARLLATSPGTALPGREPMNPRGRQYGLGGSLDGWSVLREPSRAQRLRLRAAYAGCNPVVFSRYGRRQLSAPLPWVRVVVKDPFATLSVPAIVRITGASAVIVYRHPAAALSSYRQMNWKPDLDEILPLVRVHRSARGRVLTDPSAEPDAVEAMALFWSGLYEICLDTVEEAGLTPLVVSHEELAGGGLPAAHALFDALGLKWGEATAAEMSRSTSARPERADSLHHFDRAPADAASQWRRLTATDEVDRIEELTVLARRRLEERRTELVS